MTSKFIERLMKDTFFSYKCYAGTHTLIAAWNKKKYALIIFNRKVFLPNVVLFATHCKRSSTSACIQPSLLTL